MNDYVTSSRIRQEGYSDSFDFTGSGCQKGGSQSSDMVMNQLNNKVETKGYPTGFVVKGDMNSLNTYQTTGGARKNNSRNSSRNYKNSNRSKRSKRSNRSKKSKRQNNSNNNSNNHRNMRGGAASDWLMSQNSLGSINSGSMNALNGVFSASQGVDRNILMNPPTRGLAGSGYQMSSLEGANVQHVGAPVSF
jgi:hypothetical protein